MGSSRKRSEKHRGFRSALLATALSLLSVGLTFGILTRPRGSDGAPARDVTPRAPSQRHFVEELDVSTFLRGNLHVHSARSDGSSPAAVVIAWYRKNGYQFLALTDHNRRLDTRRYRHAERDDFVLLPGEEVTMAAAGRPVHVNALCTERTIGEAKFEDRVAALRWATAEIGRQGGVALINHPNFLQALGAEHIAPATGARLLEIYSGHPQAHSDGDAAQASVEALWDRLLAQGSTLAPVAVDDAHWFTNEPIEGVPRARPGTGWIEVFADEVRERTICRALRHGRLYASNGPRLERLAVAGDTLTLWTEHADALVDFIGRDGEVLASTAVQPDNAGSLHASYQLRGDEAFVRARLTSSMGRLWTPAFATQP